MHWPGLLFVCLSFLNLWCSEKGPSLAVLKTKNFISPDEQLLRYQEPMVRLLCSTCPWITPGDSLLIWEQRQTADAQRTGKESQKTEGHERWQTQWRALGGLTKIWEEIASDRCKALKKNRVVQVVGPNSSLWETVSQSPSFLWPADRFLVITSGIFGFHPPSSKLARSYQGLHSSPTDFGDIFFTWKSLSPTPLSQTYQGCPVTF